MPSIVVRFILPWSFLVFFIPSAVGQGTRELIDLEALAPRTTQPPPTTTPSPTPLGSASQSGRVLIPLPDTQTAPTSAPGPAISGGGTFPSSVPAIPFNSSMLRGTSVPNAADMVSSSDNSSRSPAVPSLADRITSLLEDPEDMQEERNLLLRRQQAERTADPEQRTELLRRVEIAEENFKNRLARRKTDEAGANLFYHPRLKDHLLAEGWCQLFDGHTDFGWKVQTEGPYAGPYKGGKFSFGAHEIVSDPWHPGLVYTQIPFGDISLRFDYWAEKDSEVFLLMNAPPDTPCLYTSCYTFVLNSSKSNRPRGLLLDRHGQPLAELRAMREAWDNPHSQEEGAWHSALVKIERSDVQISINKRNSMSYHITQPIAFGHIAFLVTKGKARFQNILWRPSQPITIFDPDNTFGGTPWQVFDGGAFSITDEIVRLSAGSVESKDVYRNYMLQMQYKQGRIAGQSSLFVHSLPGRADTGYEISLQNFPRRKDRETAVGVDAGGFPLIKNARYIRAEDLQWTYLTVVVMDRQIQTWVNGVPVCEIHEHRSEPDYTPTNRLKDPFLKPGTIRLTVPKNNTEFQFRNLTVAPVQ